MAAAEETGWTASIQPDFKRGHFKGASPCSLGARRRFLEEDVMEVGEVNVGMRDGGGVGSDAL